MDVNTATPAGFRPAHRLLDLANLVRREPAATREQIAGALAAHGETPADLAGLDESAAARLREVAGHFGELLTLTGIDAAAHALNAMLDAHTTRPRLSNHDGHSWHLHVERTDDWGTWLAASGALALAQLLTERGRVAWGECAATGCRTLFLDDGPGSPRRYCSATCAGRARAAEHRARKRQIG